MYVHSLYIDGKLAGYDDLLNGNVNDAIQRMLRIIETQIVDPEAKKSAYRYVLMYVTYAFSALSSETVAHVYRELIGYVTDIGSRNLLKERIASQIRFERHIAQNGTATVQRFYSDSMRCKQKSSDDKLYCISIPRLADRQRRLYANVMQVGYEAVEFRGVDAELLSSVPPFMQFAAPLGTTANIMSHVMVWQEIVSLRLPGATVLEDDAIVSDRPNWETFAREVSELDLVFLNNRVMPDYRLVPESFDMNAPGSILLPFYFGCGTEGYYVTQKGAQKLLELFEVAVAPIDIQILAHIRPNDMEVVDWQECQTKRNSNVRLDVRRIYPFTVDHPPANFSTATSSFLRGFCPGLWHGGQRTP